MSVVRTDFQIGGFRAIRLASDSVAIVVVPELGAKITSLRNLVSGREWCWHPGRTMELFATEYAASFGKGTHVGIDECLPTIEECEWNGRSMPCHGEVWAEAWLVTDKLEKSISTQIRLRQSPFTFKRKISVIHDTIDIAYTLKNHSHSPESYVWALHPLFRVGPDDRLILPSEVDHLKVSAANGFPVDAKSVGWPSPFPGFQLDRFDLGDNEVSRLKAFTAPLQEGYASILNDETGDRFVIKWDTQENPYLGVWMTRGGYQNLQYVTALEPTNTPYDSLADALQSENTILSGGEVREWSVRFIVA